MKTIEERFWPKVDVRGSDECWPWKREHSHNPNTGRGALTIPGKKHKENSGRVAFYLAHGYWPKVARHTCDNPPCCNPAHIVDGTAADNMQDSIERGRFNRGSRGLRGSSNARSKVSAEQVREIRQLAAAGITYTALSRRFGISDVQAKNIVTRKSWAHVT